MRRARALAVPQRQDCHGGAVAHARDDASHDELGQGEGGGLEGGADDEDELAEHDGLAPAETIAVGGDAEGAEGAADFVDGDGEALQGGVAAVGGVDGGEGLFEGGACEEAAHYTCKRESW